MKKPVKKMKPKIMWAVLERGEDFEVASIWDFKREAIADRKERPYWARRDFRVAKVKITEI